MRECADKGRNAVPGRTMVAQRITLVAEMAIGETTEEARKSSVSGKSVDEEKEKAGDQEERVSFEANVLL